MTCIVAWQRDGKVWMGGDSAGVSGIDITIRDDPKVFVVGPYVLGFTQSFRMGQLLMTSWKPPIRTKSDISDYRFMCTKFINSIRKCFYHGGFLHKPGDREEGGCFLVGYNGKLYLVDGDFQVGIPNDGFDAIGCGRDYALGVMRVIATKEVESVAILNLPEYDVKDILLKALETAGHFSGGVRPPYRVICGGEVTPRAQLSRRKMMPPSKKKRPRKTKK